MIYCLCNLLLCAEIGFDGRKDFLMFGLPEGCLGIAEGRAQETECEVLAPINKESSFFVCEKIATCCIIVIHIIP